MPPVDFDVVDLDISHPIDLCALPAKTVMRSFQWAMESADVSPRAWADVIGYKAL
jgi:hypothetical protein